MKIKPFKSFAVYIEETARMLRKESTLASKRRITKVENSSDVSLSNKIEQVARLLRQGK